MDLATHFQSSGHDTEQINRLYFTSSNPTIQLCHKLKLFFSHDGISPKQASHGGRMLKLLGLISTEQQACQMSVLLRFSSSPGLHTRTHTYTNTLREFSWMSHPVY